MGFATFRVYLAYDLLPMFILAYSFINFFSA